MEYHVSKSGNNSNSGTKDAPFLTISKAAKVACPTDIITVHEGTYRECVRPQRGGTSNTQRITYRAAEGEKVIIKGSEVIEKWEKVEGTLWKTVLPNSFFGEFNPYTDVIDGDWYIAPLDYRVHTGDVYINGKSCYEAESLEAVAKGEKRLYGTGNPVWLKYPTILLPEDTIYQWFAQVDEENTTIYVNCQDINPENALMEINVRQSCFYPDQVGRNYITVQGFEIAQAACPYTPPTSDQIGMLGANWAKGWIIENNILHDAKCSAISIGKEGNTGHNIHTDNMKKSGYHNQTEVVFRALRQGWSRDMVGSHIVRNNKIYDCGQNGIVGHLGCVFSHIYHNEIFRIGKKHEFFAHEIAGVKFHTPIDVVIEENCIYHCTQGFWLDWEVQGTRLTRNVLFGNGGDVNLEITHGPHLFDNNIFGSQSNFANQGQGGAYLHNLFCGTTNHFAVVMDRQPPYHLPHSTEVAGTSAIYGGDERYYNNIFAASAPIENEKRSCGTVKYEGCHTSMESYLAQVMKNGQHDTEMYEMEKQPVWIEGNCYYHGAESFSLEKVKLVEDFQPNTSIIEEENGFVLEITLSESLFNIPTTIIDTEKLRTVRFPEQGFEHPDGSSITFDTDLLGEKRKVTPTVGPLEGLKAGKNRIKVWEKNKF